MDSIRQQKKVEVWLRSAERRKGWNEKGIIVAKISVWRFSFCRAESVAYTRITMNKCETPVDGDWMQVAGAIKCIHSLISCSRIPIFSQFYSSWCLSGLILVRKWKFLLEIETLNSKICIQLYTALCCVKMYHRISSSGIASNVGSHEHWTNRNRTDDESVEWARWLMHPSVC